MTYEQLELPICLNANVNVLDFHARLSALLDSAEDSQIQEELYSLKSCGWLKSDSLKYFSQKMLQDFLTMKGGSHSVLSYPLWQSWGILWNGKCLTAKTLEYHNTGKGCSLSDILEEEVPEKYFLSDKTIQRLLAYKDSKILTE